jgi:hypothetical protein
VFAAPLCTDDGVVVAAFFGVFVTFLVYLLLGASEPAELWSGIGVIGAGVAGSSTTQSVEPAARAPTLSFTVAGALLVASSPSIAGTSTLNPIVLVFAGARPPRGVSPTVAGADFSIRFDPASDLSAPTAIARALISPPTAASPRPSPPPRARFVPLGVRSPRSRSARRRLHARLCAFFFALAASRAVAPSSSRVVVVTATASSSSRVRARPPERTATRCVGQWRRNAREGATPSASSRGARAPAGGLDARDARPLSSALSARASSTLARSSGDARADIRAPMCATSARGDEWMTEDGARKAMKRGEKYNARGGSSA